MKKRILFLSVIMVLALNSMTLRAQTSISGIVNTYSAVTSFSILGCETELSISNASVYSIGDIVIIHQTQHSTGITTSNIASYGEAISSAAGKTQWGTVSATSATSITISSTLSSDFKQTNSKIQVVLVPEYQDATVSSELTAKAWDGITGGVLAIIVNGALRLNASINVDGKGFRAGTSTPNLGYSCGEMGYGFASTSNNGADKGEGFDDFVSLHRRGRGPWTVGGGGGNNHNAGGGGGAGAAIGGQGGREWSNCNPTADNGGLGGLAFDYITNSGFLSLGGGGGAGHNNLSNVNTPGGNGGGVIIIVADSLYTNANSITASGLNAPDYAGSGAEGAGGGGGGGAVFLDVSNYAFNAANLININSAGGKGGDLSASAGPGGGGGGGLIAFKGAAPSPAALEISGGIAGSLNNGTTNLATAGSSGLIETNYNIGSLSNSLSLGPDSVICQQTSFTLSPIDVNIGSTYLWQDGSTASSFTATQSGIYWVKENPGTACEQVDSITLFFTNDLDLGNDTTVCDGILQVVVNIPGDNFIWQDGSSGPTYQVSTTAQYWVDVYNGSCITRDSIYVDYINTDFSLGNDTSICDQNNFQLNAFITGGLNYTWQDGAGGPFYTVTQTGTYSVEIETLGGCIIRDTIFVELRPDAAQFGLGDSIQTLCLRSTLELSSGLSDSDEHLWSTGQSDSSIIVRSPGIYWVEVLSFCGRLRDSVIVLGVECECVIHIPSSFSPNNDDLNDFYKIGYSCDFKEFKVSILSRWGELLYQSSDPDFEWDGSSKGQQIAEGSYVIKINYSTSNGTSSESQILNLFR